MFVYHAFELQASALKAACFHSPRSTDRCHVRSKGLREGLSGRGMDEMGLTLLAGKSGKKFRRRKTRSALVTSSREKGALRGTPADRAGRLAARHGASRRLCCRCAAVPLCRCAQSYGVSQCIQTLQLTLDTGRQ